ncbi:D-alanyl-D-alanine carboxypeptidase [Blautia luti]|uniref:D-alanyl-D-alanine carboxypeptidase family protein n=1 Tax=Blautia luti TaxID=89014 RepID=UPI001D00B39C|nr:D-alanyl-D-alanine carboxypeptidase family protein [Blautia luti]MCB5473784.1 D-alanyl-D-alanine carboxypeptidase [Blautia luti]
MNRKKLKFFLVWLIVISFILTPAGVWGETAQDTENSGEQLIEAPSAVLMEKETGTVIYSRDPDTRRSPASITKIMTLILIFDAIENGKLHLDDTITTSAYAKSMGGSQVFLEEGETQKAETMIKCIVIASGNDASVAMAEHLSGTEQAFVEQMNKRAAELGMKNTHFADCCGLTESRDHYTTAYDIALMSRELITRYPQILTYSSIWMEDITHVTRKGSSRFTLTNTNKLLRSYEGCKGLKTGSTSIAKYCLSAVAERNGVTLIASVMAAPDPKTRFRDAASLFNYGFSKCTLYLDEALETLPPVKVRKGMKEEVALEYAGKFRYLSTDGTKPDNIEKKRILPKQTTAPVKKGEKAGVQEYFQNGKKIGTLDILYAEPVEKVRYKDWAGRVAKAFLL